MDMSEKQNFDVLQKSTPWLRFGLILGLLILVGGVGILAFDLTRKTVSTWEMTTLPGLSIGSGLATATPMPGEAAANPGEESASFSAAPLPAGPTPEPWDGASRVTVLVMGLDYRDWESGDGPPRTDTMILFTIDPVKKTAGILSIPRDLWVNVPGYGYYKINQAYQLGEANKIPGGGPELARQTVESLIGVPVQYYAQIDFSAFVRFIDELGGVKVTIPNKIKIDLLGDEKGTIKLKPGTYTLPGDYALAYARARNTKGGDFDRAARQQQVIMGIRDRILSFDLIPILITKAPVLYQELSAGVHTNLTLEEAIQLAWLAQQIPDEAIKKGIIGAQHVNFAKSPDGLDVLKPLPDQIRLLRDDIFDSAGAASPMDPAGKEPVELMAAEGAKLSLLNGTLVSGLAGSTGDYLQSLGATVTVLGDSENKPQPYTMIYDYTGNPYTVKYLVELMQISEFRIFFRYTPESEVDVTVILGDDWAATNPMP